MCGLSRGIHFCDYFWGGPLLCSLLGGPLPCSLPGGPLPCSLPGGPPRVTSEGPLLCSLPGGSTSVFTSGGFPYDLSHNALIYHYRMPQCIMGTIHMGGPLPCSLGGSHVTYPIMLLYTTIECLSASWAKFKIHMGPPTELNRLTDDTLKTLPSCTLHKQAIINSI